MKSAHKNQLHLNG